MPFVNIKNIQNKVIYIVLFLTAFGAVYTSVFNPLDFRRMHVDTSVYITIAQGITRGHLPYRDFVDNKGPLTYFLSVPGLFLGGFTGVWITELVLLFVTAVFAWKTALFFVTRKKALFVTAFSFVALLPFFIVNAGTEEYSLPFLMISFYIFTKYYFSPKQNVSFGELIVLGICFASAIMIRLNMFPLWAGFCMVIFIESLIKKRFTLLGKYAAGFCLGVIIIFIPVFLYLKLNGIMGDFFIQVIFNGAARGFNNNLKEIAKNFYRALGNGYSFLPLVLGFFWMIAHFNKPRFTFYACYTFSYIMMILFFSFLSDDAHYNLVLIPYFIPALAFLTNILYGVFSRIYSKKISLCFLSAFFCFVFSEALANYLFDASKIFWSDYLPTGKKMFNAGRIIDENTRPGEKIISLGYDAYIYPFTQRASVSKYFYQGYWLGSLPNAREDFLSDVLTGKPAVIALFFDIDETYLIIDYWHAPIVEMLDSEYRILSDESGFLLYIRK